MKKNNTVLQSRNRAQSTQRTPSGKSGAIVIVAGSRQVGKTELLKQFALDKDFIYFLADLSSDQDQLQQFSERIRHFTHDESLVENPFSNWSALFAYLRNFASKQRIIVIIDEYQYLQSSNRAISSIIQKAWDEGLKDTSIFLILCGSYISFMEHDLLAYKSLLYGKRTAQFFIEPMNFSEARVFFDRYSMLDKIRAYGLLGGIPAYLLQFDPARAVEKNIESAFLYKDAFLDNETRFLLMEELREPKNYFSILKTIAFGATRITEIIQKSDLDRGGCKIPGCSAEFTGNSDWRSIYHFISARERYQQRRGVARADENDGICQFHLISWHQGSV